MNSRRGATVFAVASLVLAGCASYQLAPLASSHPANPAAPAAPERPPSRTLAYAPADIPPAETDGRLPEIPAEPLLVNGIERVALTRSLDLAHARQRIVVAGEQLGVTRATALAPDLDVGAGAEREGEEAWKMGPEVSIPIPLFDQGQGRIGRAAAELRRAQLEYYALGVRIRSVARSAHERMLGAEDRALYYRDVLLPLQERIVHEGQLMYNAMQTGVFQLLRDREPQIETGVAYVEALREYWLARADLVQIASGRLPVANGVRTGGAREPMRGNDRAGH